MNKIETSHFKRLIGTWRTEGTILSGSEHETLKGTDTYECILDGNYILHKADVHMGNKKSQTFEMMSLADTPEQATMQYYNSKGESGIMTGFLTGNTFKIVGDKITFEGILNDENTQLTGKWCLQEKDGTWTDYIELQLTRET